MSLFVRERERRSFNPVSSWTNGTIPSNAEIAGVWKNFSGQLVNKDMAMRVPAVKGCVRAIADRLAGAPREVYRRRPGLADELRPNPGIVDQPWPEYDGFEWFWSAAADLVLMGEVVYFAPTKDRMGFPASAELVDPAIANVVRDKDTKLLTWRFNGEKMPDGTVGHIVDSRLSGRLRGAGLVQNHNQLIGIGLAIEEYLARYFGDGAHPTVMVTTEEKVTEAQAKTIKARVLNAVLGGSREPLVMGAGAKPFPWQSDPQSSAVKDIQLLVAQQVAIACHLPPEGIGSDSGHSMTYTTTEGLQRRIDADAVFPRSQHIGQHISESWLNRPSLLRFDFDRITEVDFRTRAEIASLNLRSGRLTANEDRANEGLPPVTENGDGINWPPMTTGKVSEVGTDVGGVADDPATT